MKNINEKQDSFSFEDIYESFHLNTVHRHFYGTDSSLIAVFSLFELLHNFRDFVNYANGKYKQNDWVKNWYKSNLVQTMKARPDVYHYVFKRKRWLSKKAKNRILEDAEKELAYILEATGIGKFISECLDKM